MKVSELTESVRIIPAYAGQMQDYILQLPLAQDHPRIRGTNFHTFSLLTFLLGSSPHTRDKFVILITVIVALGIIPAYAGQISISERIG